MQGLSHDQIMITFIFNDLKQFPSLLIYYVFAVHPESWNPMWSVARYVQICTKHNI